MELLVYIRVIIMEQDPGNGDGNRERILCYIKRHSQIFYLRSYVDSFASFSFNIILNRAYDERQYILNIPGYHFE